MKKFLHLLIFLLIFFLPVLSYSQLDGRGIALNFTLTDTGGVSHTLYDYLDNGKVVVLDFFATWCGPCNNNANAVESVWNDCGPDGDNTIMMFLMESSSSSSFSDLQTFMSAHSVTCPTFDQCETTDVPSDYQVGYFPTYYIIYSDRSYKQVSGGPTTIAQTMKDAIAENPGLSTTTYDAKVLEFDDPIGSFCSDSIRPKVTIQNYGTVTLTSVDIKSIIDGNVINTYNWSGSLAQYEIEEIELSDITGIAEGNHTFTFGVENPNGETDVDNSNDTKESPFVIIYDGSTITVSITTDSYPSETSWAILDGDDIFTSGGGFNTANHKYTEDVCVNNDSCYTFVIYDSYGDGNTNKPVEISLDGFVLGTINNFSTGASASVDFCALIPAPTITFNPADEATDVESDIDISISFDMAVRLINDDPITNPKALITVKKDNESGEDVAFTASINDDKNLISVTPNTYLDELQTYYISIGALVENNYDLAVDQSSSSFTTREYPTVTTTINPTDGATNVVRDADITIAFDLAVRLINDDPITDPAALITLKKDNESGEDVTFTASINDNKTIITIDPDDVLDSEQAYYVNIGALVENKYNKAIEDTSSTFTTGTTTDIGFDISSYKINVYPNPFKDKLIVSYQSNKQENAVIEIYNQTGVLVKTINPKSSIGNQEIEINTRDMSNGIYLLNLKINDNRISKKIVLLR